MLIVTNVEAPCNHPLIATMGHLAHAFTPDRHNSCNAVSATFGWRRKSVTICQVDILVLGRNHMVLVLHAASQGLIKFQAFERDGLPQPRLTVGAELSSFHFGPLVQPKLLRDIPRCGFSFQIWVYVLQAAGGIPPRSCSGFQRQNQQFWLSTLQTSTAEIAHVWLTQSPPGMMATLQGLKEHIGTDAYGHHGCRLQTWQSIECSSVASTTFENIQILRPPLH